MHKPGLDVDAVARLLHFLDQRAPGPAVRVRELWDRASEPFRVWVAGRAWSGKSTIAALLPGTIVDDRADYAVYVLPGSLRPVDRTAIDALDDPIVVLNKADAVSPDPGRIAVAVDEISAVLARPVIPLTAHVADLAVRPDQFDFLRALAGSADAGSQVASIVFGDSPVRDWGPPAVAVAISALRLDHDLGVDGLKRVLTAFSGIDALRGMVGRRMAAVGAARAGDFVDALESLSGDRAVRDAIEQFLAGPGGGELALRAAGWSGESVHDLRLRSLEGTAAERRAAIRAERALVRRLQPA